MLHALFVEYNRIFFENKLTLPEFKLRAGKMFESKYVKGRKIIVVNKKNMLMSNDTVESSAKKIDGMGIALREAMVLQSMEEIEERKPIRSKRFHKIVESMNAMRMVRD